MSEWYPIVHGRTAFVDFRSNLIVVPEVFGERDLEWAKRYILATTRAPEHLPGHPRWSVFANRDFVVAGVTCMAREVSQDMTHEIVVVEGREVERRALYAFLGWAARRPVSGIPPRDLALFSPLYRFVRDRWREQSYDARQKHVSSRPVVLPHAVAAPPPELNRRDDVLLVWRDSQADRLWAALGGEPDASLCIGMPSRTEALASPFQNVTLQDREEQAQYRREPERPRARPHTRPHAEPRPGRDEESWGDGRTRGDRPPWTPEREWGASVLKAIGRIIFAIVGSILDHVFGGAEPARGDGRPWGAGHDEYAGYGGGTRRDGYAGERDTYRQPVHPQERGGAADAHGYPAGPPGFVRPRTDAAKMEGTWDGWDAPGPTEDFLPPRTAERPAGGRGGEGAGPAGAA